ncbi:MAG: transcription termination/antitermination protein NusA [Chloroflexi bacterium]|nr:transcription termination/antitermination protein NusA [Chloroflexota bacterium]
MKNDFVLAISQLSAEKNLDQTKVFEAVEAAMASAYKKDELLYAEVEVKIDIATGDIDAWRVWEVRDDEEIEDDELQVTPERATEMGWPGQAPGALLREPLEASLDAGRIAAQTAKQVVLQRLREAEREAVYGEFTTKQGELVSGTVLRVEPGRRQVILDLGRAEAVLPASEQVRPEHYRVGQRLRVYIKEVYRASKGPQVVASRAHPELLRRLLELEVPEVAKGVVEIMGMSREPGFRSKIAVISRQHGVDPIGAVVGMRGARIQNVVNELGGERVDIIRWDPNETAFVANALSPAEVVSIRLDEDENTAFVAVPDKQLSLAIGKEGQNARLAAKLTGRRIEITAEGVLIRDGEDLYPPPEPNMEAIPVAEPVGLPTVEVTPAGPDYVQPGLPGERAAPAPVVEEPAALTPEQEVLAEFAEPAAEVGEVAEPAAAEATPEVAEPEVAEAPAEPEPEPVAASAPRGATSGLRFAEEIGDLRDLDDEDDQRRQPARRARGRRRGPAQPERPARPARRGSRRFEVDEDDIEEGLSDIYEEYEDEDEEYDEYS